MPETTDPTVDPELPPPKDGTGPNTLPELDVGDRVYVETESTIKPNRTLTVTKTKTGVTGGGILSTRGNEDGYVLEGYGTEYHLITDGTPAYQRVFIVFASEPDGEWVSNIVQIDE